MIAIDTYYPPANSDYEGNPLATCWPPLTPDVLATVMSCPVEFDIARREHDAHLRIQYVMGIQNFYLPLDHQVDWAWRLWCLILEGLKLRSPAISKPTAAFNTLCDSIVKGLPQPSSAPDFLESPWCAVLIGTPGTGKSSTANALLSRLGPDLFHHVLHGELFQLLSIRIQPPKNAQSKALSQQIYLALYEQAAKTGHAIPFRGKTPDTEPQLLSAIEVLVKKLNLGILVLDELQHLYRGSGAMDDDAMKFLTALVNRLKLPVLMIGTWQCLALLGLEARLSRRGISPASAFFRKMDNDQAWYEFMTKLFELQYVRKPVVMNQAIADEFYKQTQGIQDLAVKLFVMTQIEAIANDSEELTTDLIAKVAEEHFRVVAPWVSHMRSGRAEDDIVIYDAEPLDFEKYIKTFVAKTALRARRSVVGRRRNAIEGSAVVLQVAEAIATASSVDEDGAVAIAEQAVAQAPHLPVADHVARILANNTSKGPKPSRSANPLLQKKVAAAFDALDKSDLRRIVFLAVRVGRPAEDSLAEAGFLCKDAALDISF